MKGMLLAIFSILIISSAVFSSEIKGLISAIDASNGTLEVCGVEIVTRENRTTIEGRQKTPATLEQLRKGDYVEIDGRFIDPARLEATRIMVGKEVTPEPVVEVITEKVTVEKAQPEPEAARKEVEPEAVEEAVKASDKLKGFLQNADVKTRILIVDSVIVNLDAGAVVQGADGKAISLEKLRRGNRVECEGKRLSKKEFLAKTVRIVK